VSGLLNRVARNWCIDAKIRTSFSKTIFNRLFYRRLYKKVYTCSGEFDFGNVRAGSLEIFVPIITIWNETIIKCAEWQTALTPNLRSSTFSSKKFFLFDALLNNECNKIEQSLLSPDQQLLVKHQ
jgi:hypothetical protein